MRVVQPAAPAATQGAHTDTHMQQTHTHTLSVLSAGRQSSLSGSSNWELPPLSAATSCLSSHAPTVPLGGGATCHPNKTPGLNPSVPELPLSLSLHQPQSEDLVCVCARLEVCVWVGWGGGDRGVKVEGSIFTDDSCILMGSASPTREEGWGCKRNPEDDV